MAGDSHNVRCVESYAISNKNMMNAISKTIGIMDNSPIDQMITKKLIENVIPTLSFLLFQRADKTFEFIQSDKCKMGIVLLDFDLPIFNVFDFLDKFDNSIFPFPIYILSVLNEEMISQDRTENFPVKDIFQKPLRREDILSIARDNNLLRHNG